MMHAHLRHRRQATRVETAAIMDLFAWAETQPAAPGIGHNGCPADEPEVARCRDKRAQVERFCRDCGVPISAYSRGRCEPCAYAVMRRPVPVDFTAVLKRLGSAGAAKHYGTSLSTLTRWRRECGMVKHERAKPVKFRFRGQGFAERSMVVHRDFTHVGQAVDFLRRYGPVSRCDANGKYHAAGECWNRNGFILSSEELMAKATRLGWSPVGI